MSANAHLVMYPPAMARFIDKVVIDDEHWRWEGSLHAEGYGHFRFEGRTQEAHRAAYTLFRGPVPEGMVIDHMCRTRDCVQPAHLEPVTDAENRRRGESPHARNARKTTCDSGHPFNEANTYLAPTGRRSCRPCNARRTSEYRARTRANGVVS